jgi:hypothetical protein
MRIADHAVAVQSSPVLQQPSNSVHQQQTQAPDAARAAAAIQAQRHASQVNQPDKSEGRTIQKEPKGKGRRDAGRGAPTKRDAAEAEETQPTSRSSQTGSGNLVDIVV